MTVLQKEASILEQDLDAMMERMSSNEYHNPSQNQQDSFTRIKAMSLHGEETGLLPEVLEYDDYLDKHGATGGWQSDDHKEFLRLLTVCKGDYSLTTQLCYKELIGVPKAEIIAHARWHSIFSDLSDKKRSAIATWKTQKERLKCEQSMETAMQKEAQIRERSRQAKEEEKLMRKIKSEVQHQLIDIWKKQKAEEQLEKCKEQQLEAIKQLEKERTLKLAQDERKLLVSEYQRAKTEANRKQSLQTEEQRRQKTVNGGVLDPKVRNRITLKSKQMVERRTQKEKAEQRILMEREQRMARLKEGVRIVVERDPKRLVEATEASKQRTLALTESDTKSVQRNQQTNFIRHVQHKAIPTWIKQSTGTLAI
eukprot:g5406.t1